MKGKRFFAAFLSVAVLFSLLFSMLVPSAQAGHVHENEETCTICATIRECIECSGSLSAAPDAIPHTAAPSLKFKRLRPKREPAFSSRRLTPVSLNVKLTD